MEQNQSFSDVSTHLYKRVCSSVLSVGPSVGPSVTRFIQWDVYGKNRLNAPNSSKSLPNCPRMSQNVQRCLKMSQNVDLRCIIVQMDLFLLTWVWTHFLPTVPRRHGKRRWRVFGMVYAIYALHVRKTRVGHNLYAIFMHISRSYHTSSTLVVYYCISLYDVVHYTILYCIAL